MQFSCECFSGTCRAWRSLAVSWLGCNSLVSVSPVPKETVNMADTPYCCNSLVSVSRSVMYGPGRPSAFATRCNSLVSVSQHSERQQLHRDVHLRLQFSCECFLELQRIWLREQGMELQFSCECFYRMVVCVLLKPLRLPRCNSLVSVSRGD